MCTIQNTRFEILMFIKSIFQIVVGQHSQSKPDQYTKKYKVSEIINHPDWDPTTISNDISVIKLAEDIEFNDAVQPICLPKADFEYADGL